MQDTIKPCHGQIDGLMPCSQPLRFSRPYKLWWRVKSAASHLRWHIQSKGLIGVLKYSFSKLAKMFSDNSGSSTGGKLKAKQVRDDEALNLRPGEWVEVKSEKEILATLDEKRTCKGLRWMINMRKYCGKKYRVYKRLERMILESSGEYRQVKNTVLLEGVTCDGEEWFSCDRSCYHFWREVWLKRVE